MIMSYVIHTEAIGCATKPLDFNLEDHEHTIGLLQYNSHIQIIHNTMI